MKKKKLNIAIIGLGNIGINLFNYLKINKLQLLKKTNKIPNIIFVSARNKNKKRKFKINKKLLINNYIDAAKNKKVDLRYFLQKN